MEFVLRKKAGQMSIGSFVCVEADTDPVNAEEVSLLMRHASCFSELVCAGFDLKLGDVKRIAFGKIVHPSTFFGASEGGGLYTTSTGGSLYPKNLLFDRLTKNTLPPLVKSWSACLRQTDHDVEHLKIFITHAKTKIPRALLWCLQPETWNSLRRTIGSDDVSRYERGEIV